jgi:tetratricopeptide (TPR) repeat protein
MKCPECDGKFVDYLYNELAPDEKLRMDEHFKACAYCAKELSQLQFVSTSFQKLKNQEAPSLVHQRILAHSKDMAGQKRGSWLTQFIFKPAPATIMAVFIAMGVFYYNQQSPSPTKNTVRITPPLERSSATTPPVSQPMLVAQADSPAPGMLPQEGTDVLQRVTRSLRNDRGTGQAPSIQSQDALYAIELGNLYFSQGELEKAIATYSIALTMNPNESYTSLIRYQLALSYKQLNDCSSAVQVLDDIQKRFPDYQDMDKVFMMAGDCYLNLEAYDKAETNYSNFISKFPDKQSEVVDKLETARKFRSVNLAY